MKLVRSLVISLAAAAAAAGPAFAITEVTTGVFSSPPNLGYSIRSEWHSSLAGLQYAPVVVDNVKFATGNNGAPIQFIGELSIGARLIGSIPATAVDVDSFHLDITTTVTFINLATGLPALPALFDQATANAALGFRWSSSLTEDSSQFAPQQVIRFSNPIANEAKSMRDINGTAVGPTDPRFSLFVDGYCGGVSCKRASPQYTYSYAYDFVPGHFLTASNDPACADFSCMLKGRDQLVLGSISNVFSINAVPEPATLALCTAGLAMVVGAARRRHAS